MIRTRGDYALDHQMPKSYVKPVLHFLVHPTLTNDEIDKICHVLSEEMKIALKPKSMNKINIA